MKFFGHYQVEKAVWYKLLGILCTLRYYHPSVHMTQRFVNQGYPTLIKGVIISHNYACMLMKMERWSSATHLNKLTNLTDIITFFHSTVVDCGTLNTTMNGQVSHLNGTTFGQTATYSCNTGYNLFGGSTRICQADRMWSWSEPTCISEPNLTVHM